MTAILKIFDLVPGWIWAIACAALLLTAGVERARGQHARTQLAEVKAQIATERAAAEKKQRDIEAQRDKDINEVATNAQAQINAISADLAASRASADGLRDASAVAARRARARACAPNPGKGEPDSDPIGVLADVLGRSNERHREVADYADRLRVAGAACEAAYGALRQPEGVKLFK